MAFQSPLYTPSFSPFSPKSLSQENSFSSINNLGSLENETLVKNPNWDLGKVKNFEEIALNIAMFCKRGIENTRETRRLGGRCQGG